jgi:SAM-dependent methyltransferase
MVHYDKCPLCNSENIEGWLHVPDHFLTGEKFELVKCSRCGFLFTQDHPDTEQIGRYYETSDYISHNDSAGGISASIYRIAREFMLKRKRKMVRNSSGLDKGIILDIGSGTGHFLSVMKKGGWQVKGIEINDKAREFSKAEFGLDVLPQGSTGSLPSESFDVITLWHVLEHIQDPFSYASEIARLLKSEGVCIVALPNCGSFDARSYRELWAAYDVPRHLWHFKPDTFKLFAEQAGFAIITVRSLPLDVIYISMLSEKYRGSSIHFLKGMVKGIWFMLLSLFQKSGSSSFVYILRKKGT